MDTMTGDKTYNGWTNYETWSVALIIDNDQGLQEHARAIVHDHAGAGFLPVGYDPRYRVAEALKDWIETEAEVVTGMLSDPRPLSYLWSQLISAALGEVDWEEIATNYLEEEA